MKIVKFLSSTLSALRPRLLICSLLFGFSHSVLVGAQDIPKGQIPARTELHSFQSLTISDAAFLKGKSVV